jgi:zinc transporter ZupT
MRLICNMKDLREHADLFRAVIIGFLLVFIVELFAGISDSALYIGIAIVLSTFAWFLSKYVAQHFHAHTDVGIAQVTATSVLFLANIFHPAIDGFSFYQTSVSEGLVTGIFFAVSIVIHELFRQTALITAFAQMGIKRRWVIGTALLGVGIGISAGLFGTHILQTHERIVDIVTLFAYVFIIGEFWHAGHAKDTQKMSLFVTLGIVIGVFLSIFFKAH